MKKAFLILSAVVACWAAPPTGNYQIVWSDEFNDASLDTTKWEYRGLGPRRDAVNTKESIVLTGSKLAIVTRYINNQYETGMIGTQPKFLATYGYWECSVKLQRSIGYWSAFWLQSPTVSQVGDPAVNGTEIDIFEYLRLDSNEIKFNLHWDGYDVDHKTTGSTYTKAGIKDGYHTIGLEWTASKYAFYVDGTKAWETTSAVSHRSQYIILSCEVESWGGDITQGTLPDTVFFDYVRVYQINTSTTSPQNRLNTFSGARTADAAVKARGIYDLSGRLIGRVSGSASTVHARSYTMQPCIIFDKNYLIVNSGGNPVK